MDTQIEREVYAEKIKENASTSIVRWWTFIQDTTQGYPNSLKKEGNNHDQKKKKKKRNIHKIINHRWYIK